MANIISQPEARSSEICLGQQVSLQKSERRVFFLLLLLQPQVKLFPLLSSHFFHGKLLADVQVVDHPLTFLVLTPELLGFDFEAHVLSLEVFEPGGTVRDGEVVGALAEDPVGSLDHLGDVEEGVVRAHERIDGGLVEDQVERGVGVGHLADVHDVVTHAGHALLLLAFDHLLDDCLGYVIAGDAMVAILIEILLDTAVPAPDVQNEALFALREAGLEEGLHKPRHTFRRL
jgi:hypothetical protein